MKNDLEIVKEAFNKENSPNSIFGVIQTNDWSLTKTSPSWGELRNKAKLIWEENYCWVLYLNKGGDSFEFYLYFLNSGDFFKILLPPQKLYHSLH